ncbi:MAG TPA: site-2 protease family protein [Thermomicrobiaceae bacterium]|nr:site-2 protease family protein [Thermomicrobiaceae bacterium]
MLGRPAFAIRLSGSALTVQLGWALVVLGAAAATLVVHAPNGMAPGRAGAWYAGGVLLAAAFFASLLAHEWAHLWVARLVGQPQPRIRLYPFGGAGAGFVDPGSPRQHTLVAIAGPTISFILAAVAGALWWVLPRGSPLDTGLGWVALGNLALAGVNLLPGYPLDGGRVFRALIWYLHDDFTVGTRAAVAYAQAISVLGFATGLVMLGSGSRSAIWGLWVLIVSWGLNRASRDELTRAFFALAGAELTAGETIEGMNGRVTVDAPLEEVIDVLLSGEHAGPALVVDDRGPVGVLTLEQLRHFRRAEWPQRTAAQAMIPLAGLARIESDTPLRDLLSWLTEGREDVLLVSMQGEVVGAIDRRLALQRLLQRARSRRSVGRG